MKKLLAVLLAVVMAMGVFAVGASAAAAPASVTVSDLANQARERRFAAEYFSISFEAARRRDLSAAEIAAKRAALEVALEAANSLDGDERLLARYELQITFYESLLVPESLVAVDAYAFYAFVGSASNFDRESICWDVYIEAMRQYPCVYFDVVLPLLEAGQWEQAAAHMNSWTASVVAVLEDLGATVFPWPEIVRETPAPPPWHENLPAFVQFILRWIFFGWIWM